MDRRMKLLLIAAAALLAAAIIPGAAALVTFLVNVTLQVLFAVAAVAVGLILGVVSGLLTLGLVALLALAIVWFVFFRRGGDSPELAGERAPEDPFRSRMREFDAMTARMEERMNRDRGRY